MCIRDRYDIADLGTLKTDALTKNIKRFNPFIEITDVYKRQV